MEFKSLLKVLQKEHASTQSKLEKIAFAIGAITALAEGKTSKLGRPTKRRTMSASARRKIGAAQRARWAKLKAKG